MTPAWIERLLGGPRRADRRDRAGGPRRRPPGGDQRAVRRGLAGPAPRPRTGARLRHADRPHPGPRQAPRAVTDASRARGGGAVDARSSAQPELDRRSPIEFISSPCRHGSVVGAGTRGAALVRVSVPLPVGYAGGVPSGSGAPPSRFHRPRRSAPSPVGAGRGGGAARPASG
jgi:hypothetical protein